MSLALRLPFIAVLLCLIIASSSCKDVKNTPKDTFIDVKLIYESNQEDSITINDVFLIINDRKMKVAEISGKVDYLSVIDKPSIIQSIGNEEREIFIEKDLDNINLKEKKTGKEVQKIAFYKNGKLTFVTK